MYTCILELKNIQTYIVYISLSQNDCNSFMYLIANIFMQHSNHTGAFIV